MNISHGFIFKGFGEEDRKRINTKISSVRKSILNFIAEMSSENEVIVVGGSSGAVNNPDQDLLNDLEKQYEDGEVGETDDACRADLDAVLDSIQPEELFGENLSDRISTTFEGLMRKEFAESEVKDMKTTLKIPNNARVLGVPKVPKALWKQLSAKAREDDLKSQGIQQSITRTLVATAKMTQMIYETKEKVSKEFRLEMTKNLMEVAKNLSLASRDMSVYCRQSLKPHLNQDAASICSGSWEPNEFLVPEDFEKELKLTKAASSLVKSKEGFVRYHPYPNKKDSQGNYNVGQGGFQQNPLNYWGNPHPRGGGRFPNQRQNYQQGSQFHPQTPNNRTPE